MSAEMPDLGLIREKNWKRDKKDNRTETGDIQSGVRSMYLITALCGNRAWLSLVRLSLV